MVSIALHPDFGSGTRALEAAEVDRMRERITEVGGGLTDAERVELIRALEQLKSAAAATQARVTVDLHASQRSEQAARGVRAAQQGRGVAEQVALARRDSPSKGRRHLGLALVLVREMPHTLDALTVGAITEWRATLIARETAILTAEDRAAVDRRLCGDQRRLATMGDKAVADAARRLALELDPAAAVRRASRAEGDRHVSIRPAPDTMARVSALLPVAQGVALVAALRRQAESLAAAGDGRSRGQAMADTLVERVTGQARAAAVPVGVHLVMAATSALGSPGRSVAGVHEPAHLDGYGPVPAEWARDLVRRALDELGSSAAGWFRRLFSDPVTGELVAMDSRSRCFPDGLGAFLHARDAGTCRTPWCGAPIRHHDHVVAVVDGGETSAGNGQGLCEQCNHAKQAPGWTAVPRPGPRHTVETTTPTGHRYRSTAPPLPGHDRPPSELELRFARLVRSA